jgi:hypothetical protein
VALDDLVPPRLDAHQLRTVAPFESLLLEAVAEPAVTPALPEANLSLPRKTRLLLQQPNLARLDDWRMALLDRDGHVTGEADVRAMPLANQLRASRLPFAPEFKTYFGLEPELRLPPLRVRYGTKFTLEVTTPVELVVEPDSLAGQWTLRVNDSPAFTAADLAPTATHIRGSLGLNLTPHLQPGVNRLMIEIETTRLDDGLLNPLYLAGRFGVRLAPLTLTTLPTHGAIGDWDGNGLPHYAGAVEHLFSVDVGEIDATQPMLLQLPLPAELQDALEISFNGQEPLPLLWNPRCVKLPPGHLRSGVNQLCLRHYSTLSRAFDGLYFNVASHTVKAVGG